MEEQETAAPDTAVATAEQTADTTDAGEFKSEESKKAVLADLAKERDRRQQLETRLAELESKAEESRKAAMSEQERTLVEAVEAARAEERGKFKSARLEDRVLARAARILNDPSDAVRLLDTSGIDVDSADADSEIESRLNALVEAKPYLALTEKAQPSGSGDATSRPTVGGYQPSIGALLKAASGRS
jgi:TolA-binding protein